MDEMLAGLLQKIKESGMPYDVPKITAAYELAHRAHDGQFRKSGDPYIIHPVAVATILVNLGLDTDSLCAALLHDVVEDTGVPLENIRKQFGSDVALLVDGVTKVGRVAHYSREEQQAESIRKMLLAMAKDIRVILIKLADRLHNMRTLDAMTSQKQLDISLGTMEVYAPIAHRLGIRTVKDELEDLSIRHLDPVAYHEIEVALKKRKDEREAILQSIQNRIAERLQSLHMNVHIEGRVKSIYGIYRKVYMKGRAFEQIYDIYAVRVIVDTVNECYNILGVIHDLMKPVPGRFKDYISTPKPNMYQSLHTTVIGKEGVPIEVQIRTWDMHHTAEYGIAAHWKYKLGIQSSKDKGSLESRLEWVRQLLEVQTDVKDAEDFIHSLKTDLAPDEVYVFTPRGDVINLPARSTPIDFAYAIHSEVGHRMTGAKIDGKIVPLTYELQTGQIVEVLTTSATGHGPSRDWLNIARTSEARSKIRAWFKKERREENIAEGRSEIEREFRRIGILLSGAALEEFLEGVAKRQHFNGTDEFLAAIGYGGIVLSKVIPRIKDDYVKQVHPEKIQLPENVTPRHSAGGIIVEGLDNCLVKLSRCCNPLPGDEIVGFITRGFGVSIHKRDCPNVVKNLKNPEYDGRFVHAHWAEHLNTPFKAGLRILSGDRYGLLADITSALAAMHIGIHAVNARELKNGAVEILITVDVAGTKQLENVLNRMRHIEGVQEVTRSGSAGPEAG
ncbi:RelA/SpoT family protein [Ethanoligenens harbinense]|uniref:GTP diphosphokinase n=1 Tax=Ethanoligenens harbinense (strain DSM 18485 / JCM 12961 / CGMCC 1.5033 / YUAN-3) TaxID=663278 RepID=E6U7Z2_ETHHY|nr:bifunctional (p)ppGpp synthetase/guanosine-3',5'-bis(diphosphate) 3'-pyrophosphohydrolase [Ethanoligenens harbinense]ADU25924.1 (p)ppGpp synthetase I, SpoT/RelA [Ethanoligenens harbinense YUAN-3]AVQ97317.1 bifunctional (p)ppGpp synthetase/guanosine-3',5'-bis(diphosphate) 3'-pyrophosphohydrolase [Ethanoligenens harbinense YUAN-3]AYF39981.1 bifunctional (p)ppGpp synthetase/guanosine-3',5'-bis(diphosphate) 3'-pyrophosphohydrolase [Ethanoligenens harbinense]AYF42809.1 bifunctional (p)ppGpp synth